MFANNKYESSAAFLANIDNDMVTLYRTFILQIAIQALHTDTRKSMNPANTRARPRKRSSLHERKKVREDETVRCFFSDAGHVRAAAGTDGTRLLLLCTIRLPWRVKCFWPGPTGFVLVLVSLTWRFNYSNVDDFQGSVDVNLF